MPGRRQIGPEPDVAARAGRRSCRRSARLAGPDAAPSAPTNVLRPNGKRRPPGTRADDDGDAVLISARLVNYHPNLDVRRPVPAPPPGASVPARSAGSSPSARDRRAVVGGPLGAGHPRPPTGRPPGQPGWSPHKWLAIRCCGVATAWKPVDDPRCRKISTGRWLMMCARGVWPC